MPSQATPFLYGLYQDNNAENEKSYKKYYARPVILGTLDTAAVADHMTEHGSIYGTDVVKGVLEKFFDCALELLFQNRRIKMNGLGTLCLQLHSKGAVDKDSFNQANITGAAIRLLPDATMEQQLSKGKLRNRMYFTRTVTSGFVDILDKVPTETTDEGSGSGGDTPSTVDPD